MAKPAADPVVVGLLAVAAGLLLWNLGNGYLWQDEAETAVLARNTLQFGYPRAFDGRQWVEIEAWFGYGPGQAWIYSPWIQFYLLAGVFALLGESTWAARLPFALFGWLSIYLTWRLVRRLTDDRRIHRLSVALLTCSVPFLLPMRQCRYYSVVTALMLGICLGYLAVLRRPTYPRAAGLGLLLVLLFHTNFGTFIPAAGAIAAHQLVFSHSAAWRRLRVAIPLVLGTTVPWAVFAYGPGFILTPSWGRVFDHLEYYVRITNKFFIPRALMAASWVAVLVARRWLARLPPLPQPSVRWFLALMILIQAAFLILVPDVRQMRYLIPVLPLLCLIEAWWLAAGLNLHRGLGITLVSLALLTNVLQSPHRRIPLTDFVYELTHAYRGPMEGVVDYLREHAKQGDVAKIPYDDRTLMFYTAVTLERPFHFSDETYPEWIIIRRDWIP